MQSDEQLDASWMDIIVYDINVIDVEKVMQVMEIQFKGILLNSIIVIDHRRHFDGIPLHQNDDEGNKEEENKN